MTNECPHLKAWRTRKWLAGIDNNIPVYFLDFIHPDECLNCEVEKICECGRKVALEKQQCEVERVEQTS
jgi:hypothetical protein